MTLLTKKSTWVGLLAVAGGVIEGIFDGDWASASDKIILGLGIIAARHAYQKGK